MTEPVLEFSIRQPVEDLCAYGPSFPVEVAGAPYDGGKMVKVLALIDTGAAGSAISPRLAQKLSLPVVGSGEIHEAGRDIVTADIVKVRMKLPSFDIDLHVTCLPSMGEPHDILLGRDLLKGFRIEVDFGTGLTKMQRRAAV